MTGYETASREKEMQRVLSSVSEKSLRYQAWATYSWTASTIAVVAVVVGSKALLGWSVSAGYWYAVVFFTTVALYQWRALSYERALLSAKRLLLSCDVAK